MACRTPTTLRPVDNGLRFRHQSRRTDAKRDTIFTAMRVFYQSLEEVGMRSQIRKKMHSQRGASLSVVLLLFLVCITVSSIVLAAATAAAGRQSDLTLADRRYYNVLSAQELLWDELENTSVEITRQTTYTAFADGSYSDAEENLVLKVGDHEFTNLLVSPGDFLSDEHGWIEVLAADYAFGTAYQTTYHDWTSSRKVSADALLDVDDEPAFKPLQPLAADVTYDPLEISVGGTGVTSEISDSLHCQVVVTLAKNGNLQFILTSVDPTGKDAQSYSVTFKVTEVDGDDENQRVPISSDASGTTYMLTSTNTISWTPVGVSQ